MDIDYATLALASVRVQRLAMVHAELADLGAEFVDMRHEVAAVVKGAAKRRDDRLLEKTRKEHFN